MRIDAGDIDEPVGIENPEPPIVEFQNAVFLEIPQDSIDMHSCETRRIANVFLRQWQVHLLAPGAWPLRTAADKKFEEQVSDALARAMAADAGEMTEGEIAVP